MIWQFESGKKFKSVYKIVDLKFDSFKSLLDEIATILPNATFIDRDPIQDLRQMYQDAVETMNCSKRAKQAFLNSKLKLIENIGNGKLLKINHNDQEFRIVATKSILSVLQDGRFQGNYALQLAEILSSGTGGKIIALEQGNN